MHDPFMMRESTPKETACGPGDSYCANNIASAYDVNGRLSPCSQQQTASDLDKNYAYQVYVPKYRYARCDPIGLTQCSNGADRFGPKALRTEAYLQGRGQIIAARGCFASGVKFMPQELEEPEATEKKVIDMHFYSRSTRNRRSCDSLTEIDLLDRLAPLPGARQNPYSPMVGSSAHSSTNALYGTTQSAGKQEGMTRTNALHPSWGDLRQRYS